jgi:hypothetical protein
VVGPCVINILNGKKTYKIMIKKVFATVVAVFKKKKILENILKYIFYFLKIIFNINI